MTLGPAVLAHASNRLRSVLCFRSHRDRIDAVLEVLARETSGLRPG